MKPAICLLIASLFLPACKRDEPHDSTPIVPEARSPYVDGTVRVEDFESIQDKVTVLELLDRLGFNPSYGPTGQLDEDAVLELLDHIQSEGVETRVLALSFRGMNAGFTISSVVERDPHDPQAYLRFLSDVVTSFDYTSQGRSVLFVLVGESYVRSERP